MDEDGGSGLQRRHKQSHLYLPTSNRTMKQAGLADTLWFTLVPNGRTIQQGEEMILKVVDVFNEMS